MREFPSEHLAPRALSIFRRKDTNTRILGLLYGLILLALRLSLRGSSSEEVFYVGSFESTIGSVPL